MEAELEESLPIIAATRPGTNAGIDAAALRGDMTGALVAAIVTISETVPLGLLTFAALGSSFVGMGAIAGLYGAVAAGLVAALLGGAPRMISGPRASVAVIMATMVSSAASAPGLDEHGGAMTAIALALFGIFPAGLLEALFGMAKLGRVIKFIPYPVIAGFMNGVAVLLLLSQARGLMALPDDFAWADWRDIPSGAGAWGVLTAGVTMSIIALAPLVSKRVPGLLAGLVGGLVLHYGLSLNVDTAALGPTIGAIPPAVPSFALIHLWAAAWDPWIVDALASNMPSVAILAVIAAIDSLMGAAALDSVTAGRHHSDRELLAQGLSNMAPFLVQQPAFARNRIGCQWVRYAAMRQMTIH